MAGEERGQALRGVADRPGGAQGRRVAALELGRRGPVLPGPERVAAFAPGRPGVRGQADEASRQTAVAALARALRHAARLPAGRRAAVAARVFRAADAGVSTFWPLNAGLATLLDRPCRR